MFDSIFCHWPVQLSLESCRLDTPSLVEPKGRAHQAPKPSSHWTLEPTTCNRVASRCCMRPFFCLGFLDTTWICCSAVFTCQGLRHLAMLRPCFDDWSWKSVSTPCVTMTPFKVKWQIYQIYDGQTDRSHGRFFFFHVINSFEDPGLGLLIPTYPSLRLVENRPRVSQQI